MHSLRPTLHGVVAFALIAGALFIPMLPVGIRVVCVLVAPLFAGFIAARSGPRPLPQAVLACLIGSMLLVAVSLNTATEPPAGPRDLFAFLAFVGYSTAVGAVAGFVARQERRQRA